MTTPLEVLAATLPKYGQNPAGMPEQLLRALSDAGYAVVPQSELDELAKSAKWVDDARRKVVARAVASAHLLDVPFSNAPDQSPWTKTKDNLDRLNGAVKEHLGLLARLTSSQASTEPSPEGPRGGQGELTSQRGAGCKVVLCPTSDSMECLTHGGFDVCCDHQALHTPYPDRSCADGDPTKPESEEQQ